MKNTILIILLTIAISGITKSQFPDAQKYYSFGELYYGQILYYPLPGEDSIQVHYLFRIAPDLLSFNRSETEDLRKGEFYSVPKVEISFEDDIGIIRERAVWMDTVYTNEYDLTISKNSSIASSLSIKLGRDEYIPELRLSDQSKSNLKKEKLDKIMISKEKDEIFLSNPIFTKEFTRDSAQVEPFILDNELPFSKGNTNILFYVWFKAGTDPQFDYSLEEIERNRYTLGFENIPTQKGKAEFIRARILEPSESEDRFDPIILKNIEAISGKNHQLGMISIPIPEYEVVPAKYELTIENDLLKESRKHSFDIIWDDMPLSLYKPDYAMKMMYYILTEDEYDDMNSGDDEEVLKKMMGYWLERDPTPFTPYNEAMAQYFERVDYAFFNFKTTRQKDGARTERGKIYILKGKPAEIKRELTEDGSIESWIYPNLKKKFIFQSEGSERYVLIEIADI